MLELTPGPAMKEYFAPTACLSGALVLALVRIKALLRAAMFLMTGHLWLLGLLESEVQAFGRYWHSSLMLDYTQSLLELRSCINLTLKLDYVAKQVGVITAA